MPLSLDVSVAVRSIIITLVMFLTACGSGPAPKLYLLEPIDELGGDVTTPDLDAIGLSVVTLPSYAKDERMASRDGHIKIVHDDTVKWAEAPEDAITRLLANRLRTLMKANVIVEPWPRGFRPQARMEVVFDTLLREATGGCEMSGQIRLISGDGKNVLEIVPFQFTRQANTRHPDAFFEAASIGVNDIARMATIVMNDYD